MSNPFNEAEENHLEEIERRLTERNISYAQMMKMYAEFLLNLIQIRWRLEKWGGSSEYELIVNILRETIEIFGCKNSDELRENRRVTLIGLYGGSEKERPALAALSRCVACCLYSEDGWEADKEEDLTPIPLYLFLLKRIDGNFGEEFLTYAETYLLASSLD